MTAIIATYGPSIWNDDVLRDVIAAGARSFRFSLSKHSLEETVAHAALVRKLAKEQQMAVQLFLDLPGGKPRMENDGGLDLGAASTLYIEYQCTTPIPGGAHPRVGLRGLEITKQFGVGKVLILGDGEDALEILEVSDQGCLTRPLTSGVLGRNRGISVQNSQNDYVPITSFDVEVLHDERISTFDAIILSFVSEVDQLIAARKAMASGSTSHIKLVAKVETLAGCANIKELAKHCDAILIGRGDLLLDCGIFEFAIQQDKALSLVHELQVPFCIGTELLNSAGKSWLPNRSEISFMYHALNQGIDGILLARETTVGERPLRSTRLAAELCERFGTRPNIFLFES